MSGIILHLILEIRWLNFEDQHRVQFYGCLLSLWVLMSPWRMDVMWTYKWPAPNISGFIAQLVRASHRYREVTGSNSWLFQASIRNCLNCDHNGDDHSLLNNNNNFFFFIIINKTLFSHNKTKTQINYNRLQQGVFDDQSSNKKKTLIFTKLAKNRYDRLKLKEQKALRSKTYWG